MRYVVAVVCALLLSASVIAASVMVGEYSHATKMKYDKVELPELVLVLMRTADLFCDYGYILTLPIVGVAIIWARRSSRPKTE